MKEFETRHSNVKYLHEAHAGKLDLISACFEVIDALVDACNERIENEYFHTCGSAIVKGKNCALSCYSLMLDGHAQEAGAVVRPWWEYLELLAYFQEDPHRTKQVKSNSLPSSGRLSRRVNGDLHGFRQYLNENASHRSFSNHATRHIFDSEGKLRKQQLFIPHVIIANLRVFFAMLWLFANQAAYTLAVADAAPFLPAGRRLEELREWSIEEFELDNSEASGSDE